MYKQNFPIFENNLIYLDSAASTQKPESVLNAMETFYRHTYSNVHRGTCQIAVDATTEYEKSREKIAAFIDAKPSEIIFTKGATEAVNLVANSYAQTLKSGDEIVVSVAEHHAVFVPMQQACVKSGATFVVVNVLDDGRLDMDDLKSKISCKTKLVAISQMSNVLGVKNPVREIADLAHAVGAKILIDGAQSIAHMPVSMTDIDCDFFVFSGHKVYGPTGIGILYGKTVALESLTPYQFGGDMIKDVSIEQTTFAEIPARFEAGTPPIVEAIGLGAAIDFMTNIGMKNIAEHEQKLTSLLMNELSQIPSIQTIGDAQHKSGIIAFSVENIHPSDIAFALGKYNICVRVGHHCAMPIHHRFGMTASLRVSFGIYNDESDVSAFVTALQKTVEMF